MSYIELSYYFELLKKNVELEKRERALQLEVTQLKAQLDAVIKACKGLEEMLDDCEEKNTELRYELIKFKVTNLKDMQQEE